MPVPDPMAPRKSASTERAPMHRPPKAAAVGIYLCQGQKEGIHNRECSSKYSNNTFTTKTTN